jgi:hypothetical protein
VVVDAITGLTWQGCLYGQRGPNCEQGRAEGIRWHRAWIHCDELSWGGYRDWRLPNRYELHTLVNYGTVEPAIDTSTFVNAQNLGSGSQLWTGSLARNGAAWIVAFNRGRLVIYARGSLHNLNNVSCVRSETKRSRSLRRSASGEPVVTDTATELVWQGCPAGLSGLQCAAGAIRRDFTPQSAQDYCKELNWSGTSEWDLPSALELGSIADVTRERPTVDTSVFPATPAERFCSSSQVRLDSGTARQLYVDFERGEVLDYEGESCAVRCLHRSQ